MVKPPTNPYALAPDAKVIPFTSVAAEKPMTVTLLAPKVAISAGPLGGPPRDQLAALFQSKSSGLVFHVALPARLVSAHEISNAAMNPISERMFIAQIFIECAHRIKICFLRARSIVVSRRTSRR